MAGIGKTHLRDSGDVLLRVEDLVVEFRTRQRQTVHAVSGISFDVLDGETLGLVGESGCGKSTTGRAILGLPRPVSGSVVLDGTDLTKLDDERLRRTRRSLQMIFQDPISSLNPRRKVKDVVAEGLRIWGETDGQMTTKVNEVLEAVGLTPEVVADRRPGQFSGGQCQRICIARALVLEPKVIICDEPVSALDVSVQAQIINLLEEMKARYGLTLIFIAHDLAVVKNVSDRVVVMYLGKICEVATPDELFAHPSHHYTRLLLASIPKPTPGARRASTNGANGSVGSNGSTPASGSTLLAGDLPSPIDPPSGCRFRTRCPAAQERCAREEPQVRAVRPGHFVACHFPDASPMTTT